MQLTNRRAAVIASCFRCFPLFLPAVVSLFLRRCGAKKPKVSAADDWTRHCIFAE
jgi:hypothetical protein